MTAENPRYGAHAARPLEQYLDDLDEQLKALPLTSPARAALISRIREVEQQIDAIRGL